ncbi:MAG TPA: PPC domain-containing protein, partial [Urbifossiella sp.]
MPALCLCASVVGSSAAAPPSLTSLYPASGQRGTTVQVAVAGSIDKSTKLWAAGKALQFEETKEKGQFAVKVAPDAAPGTYWLRAYNSDGASGLRPFMVGTLPELMEQEPNDEPKKPQVLDRSSVVVNGKLAKAADVDCFAVSAKKGQTLVASLEANRILKSPMDGILQIVSTDGFVLDQNNDFHGLDPQIAYAVPKDGTYVVRVFAFSSTPDTSIRFAGANSFIYRLTITTAGFIDSTMPLAVGPNVKSVEVRGWNIPDEARTIPVPPIPPG